MLKKILGILLLWSLSMSLAWAQVEVNLADQAALDGVAGIGAVMSKRILDERKANGIFKDWADLQKRVKGIGDKSAVKLSAAGLRVEGKQKAAPGVSAMPVPPIPPIPPIR
jgi:competence protein ComEA